MRPTPSRFFAATAAAATAALTIPTAQAASINPPTAHTSAGALWGSNFENRPAVLGGLFKDSVRSESTAIMGASKIATGRGCYHSRHCLKITQPAPTRTPNSNDIGRYQLAAKDQDVTNGQDRWYGWAIKYANGWDLTQIRDDRQYFLDTGGFRYTSTDANGPGGNLTNVLVNGQPQWQTGINTSSTVGGATTGLIQLGPVRAGKWVTFVQHVLWSTGHDGKVEWWRNGRKKGEYNGRTFSVPNPRAEFRLGIYEGTSVNVDRTLLYDNVKIGTSYAAVNPRPRRR